MEMSYSSIALSLVAVVVTYTVCSFLNWIWLGPKRIEKCLREQGYRGNPYRLFVGDQKESSMLIKEAFSKPITFSDDIKKRVIPHVLNTMDLYGRKSFMWIGVKPRVHITEPELIREVLTKYYKFNKNQHSQDPIIKLLVTGIAALEGEPWAKRKKIVNSAFQYEKLKLMLPAFYVSCLDTMNKWEKMASVNGSIELEMYHELETLTGDVISRSLFGSNFEEGKKIFELIKELTFLTTQVLRSVYIPGRRFMPTKRNNRLKRIDKEIQFSITEIINKKMRSMSTSDNKSSSDFLGILLENNMKENEQHKTYNAGLSIEDIIGECKIFYFAGRDTSSTFLCWTMILLSRFSEWQTRARAEVFQVFGDCPPDYDGINRLKIVTMILNEVLRLYPPVVEVTKVASEDTKLGELSIPAGVHLMMPIILLHHDPEIWGDDVKEFNPERFSEGVIKATKTQVSYFPFSLGPRMCIGQNFVMLQAKMALALILQRFSFDLSPSYVHAPYTLVTMQPQFGAHLVLKKL